MLKEFVRESNRIEGIHRDPTKSEICAHEKFIMLPKIEVPDLVDFVKVVQPDAVLRDNVSVHGVRVGNHIAPPSGPEIRHYLGIILGDMQINKTDAHETHCKYLTLHPFTDGNGRSSRALWLWQMNGRAPLGFLHHFYYQTLDHADGGK